MYLNIHTKRITKAPVNNNGAIVSTQDDLAAMGIYPVAESQPQQLTFQTFSGWDVSTGYAVKQYQDLSIDDAKAELNAQVRSIRKGKEYEPITWLDSDGIEWIADTSSRSRERINGAIDAGYTGTWFFENGNRSVTATDLQAIKTSIITRVAVLFAVQENKLNQIDALTTIEACRNYDVNAGW